MDEELNVTAVDAGYYRELKKILDDARQMRRNKVTDFTEFAAKSLETSERITANLKKTVAPDYAIEDQLLWAARDELPRFIHELQSDPSKICKHEATFVERLEQAAKMLQTPGGVALLQYGCVCSFFFSTRTTRDVPLL